MTSERTRSAGRAFAYLFERFPAFTQTFCYRECREMWALGMVPGVYSIRRPVEDPPQDYDPAFTDRIVYLPDDEVLTELVKRLHSEKRIPRAMRHLLRDWPVKRDRRRVYAAAWLGPRLRRAGVRHVHVHFAGIAARTAYWLRRFYGISYSFTGHANDIFCEPGHKLPIGLPELVGAASLVATVSDFSAERLRERFPESARKIHCAYNGIDLSEWNGTRTPPDRFRIASVGRFIEKKGFADLVEACGRLAAEGRDFECILVGEGPLEGELRERIARLGLHDKVQLAGARPQSWIRDSLWQSSVFALPCVELENGDKDNLPTVLMEAMACRIPCVSTHVAGVPEMVRDASNGTLVPQHHPDALAQAIARYMDDPDLAASHGDHGRQLAEKVFSLHATTTRLARLLVRQAGVRPTWQALRHNPGLAVDWLRGFAGSLPA